jgi:hypothetical protein
LHGSHAWFEAGAELVDALYCTTGYGIDFAERYRWLPYIGVPKPEVVASLVAEREAQELKLLRLVEAARARQDAVLAEACVAKASFSNGAEQHQGGEETSAAVKVLSPSPVALANSVVSASSMVTAATAASGHHRPEDCVHPGSNGVTVLRRPKFQWARFFNSFCGPILSFLAILAASLLLNCEITFKVVQR